MEYLTINKAAEKWGVSGRRVNEYCKNMRISGAIKKSGVWLIPAHTSKPIDPRKNKMNVIDLFAGCGDLNYMEPYLLLGEPVAQGRRSASRGAEKAD